MSFNPDSHAYDPEDLLVGAKAIARFLFGDESKERKIFYLARNTRFPHGRMGSQLCALKSELVTWLRDQIERSKRGAQAGMPERRARARRPAVRNKRQPPVPNPPKSNPLPD